jgi:hypothetical protein
MWSVSYVLGLDIYDLYPACFIIYFLTAQTHEKKNQGQNISIQKPTGPEQNFSSLSREGKWLYDTWLFFIFMFFSSKKNFFFCEKNEIIFYRQTFVTERIFIYSSRMYFNVNLFWIFIILSRADDIVVRSTGFLVREFCVCYTGRGLFSLFSCWPSCFDCGQSIFIFVCTQRHFIEYLFVRLFN